MLPLLPHLLAVKTVIKLFLSKLTHGLSVAPLRVLEQFEPFKIATPNDDNHRNSMH
jgi:hypothetical protein